MGVEEEVPSGLKAGTTSAGRWYWRCDGRPNSRQPRAVTVSVIALQYLDGSGHDLEKNEFENSLGRAGGCACVEGNPASGRTESTPRRSTHHSYSVVALVRECFRPFYLIMSNSPRIWPRRTAVEFFVTCDAKPGVGRRPLTQLRPYLRVSNGARSVGLRLGLWWSAGQRSDGRSWSVHEASIFDRRTAGTRPGREVARSLRTNGPEDRD